jgi:hypothetical protein
MVHTRTQRLAAASVIMTLLGHSFVFAAQASSPQFHNVKLMVSTGSGTTPTDSIIVFDQDTFVVRAKKGGATLKALPYTKIKSAEYSYSKSPRWKSGAAAAFAVGIFALPLFFMKGKKHWLTVGGDGDFALMQLDKENYKIILPAFEAKTGIKVVTVAEEK